ncbi:unnamed protein product [Pylaiella littoralis]
MISMEMDDDGRTPLLPRDGRQQQQEIKLPTGKLAAHGILLACCTLMDIAICTFLATGGFCEDWRRRLGLGHGNYPFGSAGFDLLLLGILRHTVAVGGCLAFFFALKRSTTLRLVAESVAQQDYYSRTTAAATQAREQFFKWACASRAWRGVKHSLIGDPEDGEEAEPAVEVGSSIQVGGPVGGSTSYEVSGIARWLEPLCPAACFLTLFFIVAKCLTRLVVGPGWTALPTPWFWAAIGWSAAASAMEFLLATGFTSTCRRYCFLHLCRARGDYQSAMEAGWDGTGAGKKNGGYSATFEDVLALCGEDWRLILCAFVALLLAALSQVLIPHFTGDMIDNVVERGDKPDFHRSTVFLVLAAFSCSVFSGIRGCIFTIVGARVNVRVRQRLFESLVRQEIGFFDTTKTGDLTSRLASDCTKVGDQVTVNVNVFLRNLVMVVVTLLFMFYLSWRLSLVAFISVPAIVTVSKMYGNYIRKLSKLSQDKLAEAGSVAEESLGSMSTVRSFAAEGRESRAYASKLNENRQQASSRTLLPVSMSYLLSFLYYVLSKRGGYAYGLYASSFVLLPNLVTAVVLFYGGQLVMEGQVTGGRVVSFMIYLTSLSDGFNDMASIFSSMTQAVGAADKVFELINREPRGAKPSAASPPRASEIGMLSDPEAAAAAAVAAAPVGEAPDACLGAVELRGVDFEYPSRQAPGRRILDGVSFNATSGQVLALVGPSGGGKSSCIALLENLYQPSRGQVMLDGLEVHKYDHQWLHRNISIVGQEPTLYARSIRENIIYGLEGEEPSYAEVEKAAKLANAHTFISHLPDKYDTQAGERGVQMSGGQKQRIAIARALVRKPKVLLLDEATSALDAESEHLVQQAIDNMISRGGMTVILIAHRLSTVKRADKIVVIRSGRVAEEGTHDELVSAKDGVYAGLVKRQLDLGDHNGGRARKKGQGTGDTTPEVVR